MDFPKAVHSLLEIRPLTVINREEDSVDKAERDGLRIKPTAPRLKFS